MIKKDKEMKKIFVYIGVAFLFPAVLVSCKKDNDFLKEEPKAQFSIDNAYQTSAQVLSTVASAYAEVQSLTFGYVNGVQSDEFSIFSVFGASGFTIGTWSSTADWATSTASLDRVNGKGLWDSWYKTIAKANQALYAADLETIEWASATAKTQLQAEARLLRAYAYLRLAECFGGVPIVDTYSETLRLDYTRASRAETYQFAIDDLKFAFDNLPAKPVVGRAGKGAAAIMLSEAYLGLSVADGSNHYADAATYAQECIKLHPIMTARFGARANASDTGNNLGVPNYLPDSEGGNPYADLFYKQNPRLAENTEAVWVHLGPDSYAHQQSFNGTVRVMSHRPYSPALRDTKLEGSDVTPWPTSGANSDFYKSFGGRTTNIPAIASNGVPFGGSPTWFATFQVWEPEYNNGTGWEYLTGDYRGMEGVSIRRYYPVTNESHPAYSKDGETLYGTNKYMKGWEDIDRSNVNTSMEYFPIHDKRTPIDSWGYDENTYFSASVFGANLFRDWYMYRSAEAYLLLAEAKFRGGDAAGAADALNVLRNRAHANPWSAAQVNLQVILDERCRELMYEEDRWATLLRQEPETWKPRIYSYGTWSYTPSKATLNPNAKLFPETFLQHVDTDIKWDLWPIPKDYVDLNTDNPEGMKQNPGWD